MGKTHPAVNAVGMTSLSVMAETTVWSKVMVKSKDETPDALSI